MAHLDYHVPTSLVRTTSFFSTENMLSILIRPKIKTRRPELLY